VKACSVLQVNSAPVHWVRCWKKGATKEACLYIHNRQLSRRKQRKIHREIVLAEQNTKRALMSLLFYNALLNMTYAYCHSSLVHKGLPNSIVLQIMIHVKHRALGKEIVCTIKTRYSMKSLKFVSTVRF